MQVSASPVTTLPCALNASVSQPGDHSSLCLECKCQPARAAPVEPASAVAEILFFLSSSLPPPLPPPALMACFRAQDREEEQGGRRGGQGGGLLTRREGLLTEEEEEEFLKHCTKQRFIL